MNKIKIESKYSPFPKPIALIGCLIDGKPNFMNIAWFNRMSMEPNQWMISMNKNHHTFQGIKENKTFSMNFPNNELVEKTDFCGLVSGRDFDKSQLFTIFYGDLKTAPLISDCPISVELEVIELIEKQNQMIIIGLVKNIYSEEKYLTNGELDPKKIQLLIFVKASPDGFYFNLGENIGQAWKIGKDYKVD